MKCLSGNRLPLPLRRWWTATSTVSSKRGAPLALARPTTHMYIKSIFYYNRREKWRRRCATFERTFPTRLCITSPSTTCRESSSHNCLGSQLVRRELWIVLTRFPRRFSGISHRRWRWRRSLRPLRVRCRYAAFARVSDRNGWNTP